MSWRGLGSKRLRRGTFILLNRTDCYGEHMLLL